jgi:Amt family ammonium transporter
VHGVGGALGAILTGVFTQKALNPEGGKDGVFFGNPGQMVPQLVGVVAVGAYSAIVTFIILKVVDKVVGLRVPVADEREGLDSTEHGEQGYAL